jgi:hypothetical protein
MGGIGLWNTYVTRDSVLFDGNTSNNRHTRMAIYRTVQGGANTIN